jgi:hypothetical protein
MEIRAESTGAVAWRNGAGISEPGFEPVVHEFPGSLPERLSPRGTRIEVQRDFDAPAPAAS